LLPVLAGCGGNWFPETAQAQFAQDSSCKTPMTIYRRDLSLPGDDPGTYETYEMRGCGRDVIYKCQAFPNDSGGLTPSCAATSWCTGPSCSTNDTAVATRVFADGNSCPLERLHAAYTVKAPRCSLTTDPVEPVQAKRTDAAPLSR
jgi:hypothetical protein